MRKYKSHKVVEAGRIDMKPGPIADIVYISDPDGDGMIPVQVPDGVFARGVPNEGDYLVRYEDGYMSWSPKEAFESGYSLLSEADQENGDW